MRQLIIAAIAVGFLYSGKLAAAYFVQADVLANVGEDVPFVDQTVGFTDGPTSVQFDSGLVSRNDLLGENREAQASASANLATGRLKAFARTRDLSAASASATFTDTLTFNLGGLSSAAIGFGIFADGNVSRLAGDTTGTVFIQMGSSGLLGANFGTGAVPDGSAGFPVQMSASGTVEIFDGIATMILASLTVGGSLGSSTMLDFGSTANILLDLPDGVTFTSESGVFLSQQSLPAVPLPASFPLFAVTIFLLGLFIRATRGASRV